MIGSIWKEKSPKLQQCKRCELSFPADLDYCTHCSELNDQQLVAFKADYEKQLEANAKLGRYLLIGAIVAGGILLLSFL